MTPSQRKLQARRERKLEEARKRMSRAMLLNAREELKLARLVVRELEAKLVALIGKRPPLIGRLMTADDVETTQGTLGGNPFSRFNERSIGCTLSQIRPMQNTNVMIGAIGHGKAESSRFAKEAELCN